MARKCESCGAMVQEDMMNQENRIICPCCGSVMTMKEKKPARSRRTNPHLVAIIAVIVMTMLSIGIVAGVAIFHEKPQPSAAVLYSVAAD